MRIALPLISLAALLFASGCQSVIAYQKQQVALALEVRQDPAQPVTGTFGLHSRAVLVTPGSSQDNQVIQSLQLLGQLVSGVQQLKSSNQATMEAGCDLITSTSTQIDKQIAELGDRDALLAAMLELAKSNAIAARDACSDMHGFAPKSPDGKHHDKEHDPKKSAVLVDAIKTSEVTNQHAAKTVRDTYPDALSVISAFNFHKYPPEPAQAGLISWSRVTLSTALITGTAAHAVANPGKALGALTGQKITPIKGDVSTAAQFLYQGLVKITNNPTHPKVTDARLIKAEMDQLAALVPLTAPFDIYDTIGGQVLSAKSQPYAAGGATGYNKVVVWMDNLNTTIEVHKATGAAKASELEAARQTLDEMERLLAGTIAMKRMIKFMLYE